MRPSSSLNGGSFAAPVCCYQAACIHVDGDNLILEPKRSLPTAFGAVGSRDLVCGWLALVQFRAMGAQSAVLLGKRSFLLCELSLQLVVFLSELSLQLAVRLGEL